MTVTYLTGDVFDRLAELPDDYFDCVVTSPPYWGLRDYGVDGQIGLERTLAEHIETIVKVCREIRRVLKPTGTFWFNYGDCYATAPNGRSAADTKAAGKDDRCFRDKPFSTIGPICAEGSPSTAKRGNNLGNAQSPKNRIMAGGYLKPKDLVMAPNRIAIALQDDGWWVRSETIWRKPNPMPESVTDRPATSHEKIFLFTKSERYFYDADRVRVPAEKSSIKRLSQDIESQKGSSRDHAGNKTNGAMKAVSKKDKQRGHAKPHNGFNDRWDQMTRAEQQSFGRNLRNVWDIATRPFKEAHFATFPPAIPELCLKAGCPVDGKVLDPFGGAGTTALVADRMGLDCTIIELNDEYMDIAKNRIETDQATRGKGPIEVMRGDDLPLMEHMNAPSS